MNENLKKFFDQLSTDPAMREKFAEQPSMDAAYVFAAEAVPDLTLEEFAAALEGLRQAAGEKLTDEELEKVDGGRAPVIRYPPPSDYGCKTL